MSSAWFRHPLAPWLGAVVLAATVVVTAQMLGTQMAILAMSAVALLAIIVLLWASLQSLTGEAELTLDEALNLAPPPAEEEQKRAVLRALKDLEYERGVGKISQEDYRDLSARYRSEAKRLIQLLDEQAGPLKERVDALLDDELKKQQRTAEKEAVAAADAPSEPSEPLATDSEEASHACPECDTNNEPDAVFCKRCGHRLESEAAS